MWLSEAHADIPINLMGPNPGPGHGGMSFANPSKPTFSMAWRHNRNAKNAQSRAKRADLSGRSSMASSVGETGGHGGHVPAAWPGLSGRCLGPEGRRSSERVEVMSHHREVTIR